MQQMRCRLLKSVVELPTLVQNWQKPVGAWDDVAEGGMMLEGDGCCRGESSATGWREATAGEDGDGRQRRPGWLHRWEVVTAGDEDEEDGCGWNRGGR